MTSRGRSHLHFVQSLEPLEGGGLGRAAAELHAAMLRAGVGSRLVATRGGRPQMAGSEGVTEFRRRGPGKLHFAPGLWRQAGPLMADCGIAHAHGFYVGTNWILGREARRQGRPLVCHPHGFFEPWILARSRARKRLVHLLFEDANFRHARLWRALTGKEADQVRAQGIRAPVVVAPNGISLEPFDRDDPGIRDSRFAKKTRRRLLFLARLHPKKGLDLLIPAWARCRAAARDWELVVAGPDELGHRAEAEAMVRARDLGDCVVFTGPVGGPDKVALLRSADAFILPSHSEGFSVAILEAMACRVPVAATRACNFPELAAEGGGWLCDADEASVAGVLAELLGASDSERRDRGLASRRLVEQRYTWPSITRTLLDACDTHC